MTSLAHVAATCLFAFAGAFALASLWHDGKALVARYKEIFRDLD